MKSVSFYLQIKSQKLIQRNKKKSNDPTESLFDVLSNYFKPLQPQ